MIKRIWEYASWQHEGTVFRGLAMNQKASKQTSSSMKVKVEYEYDKDYRLVPITGAWGGATGQGMLAVDLFAERKRAPSSIELEENETGQVVEVKRTGDRVVREVSVGLIMSPDIARIIGRFLIAKADELIALTKGEEHADG